MLSSENAISKLGLSSPVVHGEQHWHLTALLILNYFNFTTVTLAS